MLKKYYKYLGSYRRTFFLSCLFVALECGLELLIPLLMANIIDVGVANSDRHYILTHSALMMGCALLALVLGVLYARTAAIASQGFAANLREEQYKAIQRYSFSNLDRFTTSSLVTRLTSDVTTLQIAMANGIRPMIRGPVMMLLGVVLSIALSRRLAIVFYIALPLLGIMLALIIRQLGPLYQKMQRQLDTVNRVVQENLIAIKVVKSFAQGDYEAAKFYKVNEENRQISEKALHFAVMNTPAFQAVMYATTVAVLWFGGGLVTVGSMQVGQLTGFISYILQILNSLMMISGVFLLLSRSVASAGRILEVLEESPAIVSAKDSQHIISHGEIEFRQVSFKYTPEAEKNVLTDITLHILPGQTIGIVGETGSAKSSLVQLIPRLYDITSGQLLLDGIPVEDYTLSYLRDAVGMVLQQNTLFSGTIRDNLQWGNPTADARQLNWACDIAAASEFISRFPQGYDAPVEQGGSNLSGGQRQRLCIARALLKKPRILILDDSTSAVDTATEARIRSALNRELTGTTKLIIAQRIHSLQGADQIVVLQDGSIQQIGTHEELLATNTMYQDMYHTQKKGAEL